MVLCTGDVESHTRCVPVLLLIVHNRSEGTITVKKEALSLIYLKVSKYLIGQKDPQIVNEGSGSSTARGARLKAAHCKALSTDTEGEVP